MGGFHMNMPALLASLSQASSLGGEGEAARIALEEIRKYAPDASFDPLGSLVAPIVPPAADGGHLLLEAHLDEIGFVVTSVDDDGFLHVGRVGGPDLRVLLGHEVTVFGTEPLFGLFCCRPPHLTSREDTKKPPVLDELAIDIGYDKQGAEKRVHPGDTVTLRREPAALLGGLLTGKALDNRAGVAAVLRALDISGAKTAGMGLTAVFSSCEECGERGATAAAFSVKPTRALVVDVSHGYTPDAAREKCGELCKGPMIGVSPVLSREMTKQLKAAARSAGVPYQTEVMGSETGTNSDVISISRAGVKTGLVSIPLKYMHTAVEVVAVEDVENTARLIAQLLQNAGGERQA